MSEALNKATRDNALLDLHLCHTAEQKAAWCDKFAADLCATADIFEHDVAEALSSEEDCEDCEDANERMRRLAREIRERTGDLKSVFDDLEEWFASDKLPRGIVTRIDELAESIEDESV